MKNTVLEKPRDSESIDSEICILTNVRSVSESSGQRTTLQKHWYRVKHAVQLFAFVLFINFSELWISYLYNGNK